jgi:hypothetical protein
MNLAGTGPTNNPDAIDEAQILRDCYKHPPYYTDRSGNCHATISSGYNNETEWNLPIEGVFDYSNAVEGTELPTLIRTTVTTTTLASTIPPYHGDTFAANRRATQSSTEIVIEKWTRGCDECWLHLPIGMLLLLIVRGQFLCYVLFYAVVPVLSLISVATFIRNARSFRTCCVLSTNHTIYMCHLGVRMQLWMHCVSIVKCS